MTQRPNRRSSAQPAAFGADGDATYHSGSGYEGDSLAAYRITCPFCMERGNFETEHHVEKNKATSSKKLNFDTLKCGNCSGYVMVLWSATSLD